MILSGNAIKEKVLQNEISIEPFFEKQLNPNSYNYCLMDTIIDVSENKEIKIPSEGFVLEAKRLYLGSTYEKIGSQVYVPSLIGRSSLGRLGLYLQVSADLGNLGCAHCWTLELVAVQPIKVYPFMRIGQVSFWEVVGDISLYQGMYHNYNVPYKNIYRSEEL